MLVDVDWNAYDEEAARERLVTAMQFHTLIVTILLCFRLIFVVSSFQPVPQSTQWSCSLHEMKKMRQEKFK